jgi:hypothetical protein
MRVSNDKKTSEIGGDMSINMVVNRRLLLSVAGGGTLGFAIRPAAAQGLAYIGQFEFVSSHGRLLQAHTDGEMHASQETQNIGEEERWLVYRRSDNVISLQNFRNKKWLSAEPSGRAVCDRDSPNIWEEWRLFASGDKISISLLSYHGRWLTAQPPGQDTQWGGEVAADRAKAAEWERFSMVPSEPIQGGGGKWWETVKQAIDIATTVAPIVVGAM